jgi:hypothetical protein
MSESLMPMFGGSNEQFIKKTFINHVFSTTEEGKSEILNVLQYAGLAVIPIIGLNKLVQKFIPDADLDKSNLEIVFEIVLQVIILFIGIILIHRIITFIPTYSGFPYPQLMLTNATLTFLVIVLSIQTKLGIKANILVDRLLDLWNGVPSYDSTYENPQAKKVGGTAPGSQHRGSQADYLDNPKTQNDIFPPAPVANSKGIVQKIEEHDPVPAGSVFGNFGSSFY